MQRPELGYTPINSVSLHMVDYLRRDFGYELKYLAMVKQYLIADVIGESKLDQKTKETLEKIDKHAYLAETRGTLPEQGRQWREQAFSAKSPEQRRYWGQHNSLVGLVRHASEVRKDLCYLIRTFRNSTGVDYQLHKQLENLYSELGKKEFDMKEGRTLFRKR